MCEIIEFPTDRPSRPWSAIDRETPALILILPVVRIEYETERRVKLHLARLRRAVRRQKLLDAVEARE